MIKKYAIIGFLIGIVAGAILSFLYPPPIFQLLIFFSQVIRHQNGLWLPIKGSILSLLASVIIITGLIGGVIGLVIGKLRQKKV